MVKDEGGATGEGNLVGKKKKQKKNKTKQKKNIHVF